MYYFIKISSRLRDSECAPSTKLRIEREHIHMGFSLPLNITTGEHQEEMGAASSDITTSWASAGVNITINNYGM
jgi:hypothetical protein